MEKGNIIDFTIYSDTSHPFQLEPVEPLMGTGVSDELEAAIEQLIIRLKEANPIRQSR